MLLMSLAVITLCVTALLALYLRMVPEGPACPRCGAATRHATSVAGEVAPPIALFNRWTVARSCTRCAWSGRLRRGAEPRSIPGRGRPEGA